MKINKETVFYLTTSKLGLRNIFTVINKEFSEKIIINIKNPIKLMRLLNNKDKLKILQIYCNLIKWIYNTKKIDFLLLSHDLLMLISVCVLLKNKNLIDIFCDDQLQRFAFICGHSSKAFNLCQHGSQDNDISVLYRYGKIKCLWYINKNDIQSFRTYFTLNRYKAQPSSITFLDIRCNFNLSHDEEIVFLASSLPHFERELEIISKIRQSKNIFLVIKLHPLHPYTKYHRAIFKNYANYVCKNTEYPLCDNLICAKGSITNL